ncbi:TPA: hypothetical protein H1Q95_000674 [Salmonella enterica]|nr:hypothetical protein [Salmonella enterica]
MEKIQGIGKPGYLKSRLVGTTRLIKKVLQRSQYRKAVEALCSQNKKNVFGTALPACISRNTCCQKLRTESKYADKPINGFLLIASCERELPKNYWRRCFCFPGENLLYKEQ